MITSTQNVCPRKYFGIVFAKNVGNVAWFDLNYLKYNIQLGLEGNIYAFTLDTINCIS